MELERPGDPVHGDYATNVALRLAGAQRRAPLEIAAEIAGRLSADGIVEHAEAAPPGFVNIRVSDAWLAGALAEILEAGDAYGAGTPEQPERIRFAGTVDLCSEAEMGELASLMLTLHTRSLLLTPEDTKVTASAETTTSASLDPATRTLEFCVEVMPGQYDLVASPPVSMPCGLFAERRLVQAPDGMAATGPSLRLPSPGPAQAWCADSRKPELSRFSSLSRAAASSAVRPAK